MTSCTDANPTEVSGKTPDKNENIFGPLRKPVNGYFLPSWIHNALFPFNHSVHKKT
jgi:hypothetical protein